MLLAFDVYVIAIADVIAFAAASHVDETVNGLTLAERLADVALGFFHSDLSGDDQLDVEVLWVGYFVVVHEVVVLNCKGNNLMAKMAYFFFFVMKKTLGIIIVVFL